MSASPPATTESEKGRVIEADYYPVPSTNSASTSTTANSTQSTEKFLYFAYGSNLLPSMLQLKEVKVHSARCGFLQDVALLFDLKYSSLVEPCYANLQRRPGSRVHGVVYEMDAKDMETMDKAEGNGRSYVREPFEVSLYKADEVPPGDDGKHEIIKAYAYICHPNNLSKVALCPHPPSQRYLNVLVRGAKHHKLDAAYVDWLQNHPYTPLPELKFSDEQLKAIEGRELSQADLESATWKDYMDNIPWEDWKDPLYMALKGVVFDIRPSKYSNAWKKNNAGKDLTLFTAGRVALDSHSLPKDPADFKAEHKAYVNATLVDFAVSYPIVGHMFDRSKYDF